jgi:hypothetical protein
MMENDFSFCTQKTKEEGDRERKNIVYRKKVKLLNILLCNIFRRTQKDLSTLFLMFIVHIQ